MLDILMNLTAYDGQLFLNDPPDSIRFQNHIQEKTISHIARNQISLADAGSTSALVSGNVDYLLIATDQPLTATVNGSVTPVTLTPRAAGIKSLVFFNKGTVSALTINNNSGSAASIDVITVNL